MAFTKLGPIRGVRMDGYNVFSNIPYVDPIERFGLPEPKKPWGPSVMNATSWGSGCIGSDVKGLTESEDCLKLNIWLPPGGRQNMPVVVYFHGGLNQVGSGVEEIRKGDILVQSAKYPAIYVTFDFRLGMLGFYYDGTANNSGVPLNLGLRDQQQALRWVQENIPAFGGDPKRVTLLGTSFGAPNIMCHMVAPSSAGLFSKAAMISPPADIWQRDTNRFRTEFILGELGCLKPKGGETRLQCLKRLDAAKTARTDWTSDDLNRDAGSRKWFHSVEQTVKFANQKHLSTSAMGQYMGWLPIVDPETLPGEPRDLIAQGRWHKVPVLLTTVRNESLGVFPIVPVATQFVMRSFLQIMADGEGQVKRAAGLYEETLGKRGIKFDEFHLEHAMITDKLWMCDHRALARDMSATGGKVYTGMFAHKARFDTLNSRTNKECVQGAVCHACDMQYLLPQGRGQGVIGARGYEDEEAFARRYRDYFLGFASGGEVPWKEFSLGEEAWTFIDAKEVRVEPGWRREQCDALDSFMGRTLPLHMRSLAARKSVSRAD